LFIYLVAAAVVRKAVKATVVLLPLLGVIYVIFLVNPSDHEISENIFTYFNNVLQSSQVLSLVHCNTNSVVSLTPSPLHHHD